MSGPGAGHIRRTSQESGERVRQVLWTGKTRRPGHNRTGGQTCPANASGIRSFRQVMYRESWEVGLE
jgi:hypothetical protein